MKILVLVKLYIILRRPQAFTECSNTVVKGGDLVGRCGGGGTSGVRIPWIRHKVLLCFVLGISSVLNGSRSLPIDFRVAQRHRSNLISMGNTIFLRIMNSPLPGMCISAKNSSFLWEIRHFQDEWNCSLWEDNIDMSNNCFSKKQKNEISW